VVPASLVVGDASEACPELFKVDALYPAADERLIHEFITKFPWIPWPDFERELFVARPGGKVAAFLHIYHVVRGLFEEHIKNKSNSTFSATVFEWDSTDPLQDVFLAYFGSYPPKDDISKDYGEFVKRNLRGNAVRLSTNGDVNPDVLKAITPSVITAYEVEWDEGFHCHRAPR
jgi:hypothetical protein